MTISSLVGPSPEAVAPYILLSFLTGAPSRRRQSDSFARVVNTILTELDGFNAWGTKRLDMTDYLALRPSSIAHACQQRYPLYIHIAPILRIVSTSAVNRKTVRHSLENVNHDTLSMQTD